MSNYFPMFNVQNSISSMCTLTNTEKNIFLSVAKETNPTGLVNHSVWCTKWSGAPLFCFVNLLVFSLAERFCVSVQLLANAEK